LFEATFSCEDIDSFRMKNSFHQEILQLIKENSNSPTAHTFLDSYLGNSHPRYAINAPALRKISKEWMRAHKSISSLEFQNLLSSLIAAPSSTEKVMAGILMDDATAEQRKFHPKLFDSWLDYLEGWAEVDAVCTGKFTIKEIPENWPRWEKLLKKFNRDKNIHKQRASLVLLCSPIRYTDNEKIAIVALENIRRLKSEENVLITKAISWLLRSMIKNFKSMVKDFVQDNKVSLPSIAVRETLIVLKTGKKTK
jgi:3-methyladenine DNA glycosylase AlkD